MSSFYIRKTGMEIFDITRAYGLAWILSILSEDFNTRVRDKEWYFEIICNRKISYSRISHLRTLTFNSLSWDESMKTYTDRKKIIKMRNQINKILSSKKSLEKIISKYKDLEQDLNQSVINKKGTLLLSLDPRAAKGIREQILGRKYDEGSNIKCALEDVLLSIVGHLNSTVYNYGDKILLGVVPGPSVEGVLIRALKDVHKHLADGVKSYHPAGTFSTVTYSAILLYLYILKRTENKTASPLRRDDICSLFFYSMNKTGSQWKPGELGVFDMSHLDDIPKNILEIWADLLRKIRDLYFSKKGDFRNVAVYLAEFIENKSLESYTRYVYSHLNMKLKCNSNKKLAFYAPKYFEYNDAGGLIKNVHTL
jgi:hypothetical protein